MIEIDVSGDMDTPIQQAAEVLLSGGTVVYPTESFYGLAVDATNEKAIRRLFQIKKRDAIRPVLILIHDVHVLDCYVRRIPRLAPKLIETFWPGGLTLVFEASSNVSPLLTGGSRKIGIRLSSHPIATALAKAINAPISGTSANLSGRPPCRSADEVLLFFGSAVDLFINGGKTEGRGGSTVLDMTVKPPQILREGMISKEALEPFFAL